MVVLPFCLYQLGYKLLRPSIPGFSHICTMPHSTEAIGDRTCSTNLYITPLQSDSEHCPTNGAGVSLVGLTPTESEKELSHEHGAVVALSTSLRQRKPYSYTDTQPGIPLPTIQDYRTTPQPVINNSDYLRKVCFLFLQVKSSCGNA